jgi:hypothetical protein
LEAEFRGMSISAFISELIATEITSGTPAGALSMDGYFYLNFLINRLFN